MEPVTHLEWLQAIHKELSMTRLLVARLVALNTPPPPPPPPPQEKTTPKATRKRSPAKKKRSTK